ELASRAEPEGAPQLHAGAFDGGHRLRDALNWSDGHRVLLYDALRSGGNRRLLTRSLECVGPPDELVEHVGCILLEIRKLPDLFAALPDGHEVRALNMDTGSRRRHLELDGDEPQLFDRAGRSDRAIADESGRLLVPFRIGVIEGVLQHRWKAAIVFCRHKDIAIELSHFALPAPRDLVVRRDPRIRRHLVEEGHRIVTQVQDLRGQVVALRRDVLDPLGRLVSESGRARRADDDADLDLGHGGTTLVTG